MHSAFSYDRRDPYTRLPIDTTASAAAAAAAAAATTTATPGPGQDPLTVNNSGSEHVSKSSRDNGLVPCLCLFYSFLPLLALSIFFLRPCF